MKPASGALPELESRMAVYSRKSLISLSGTNGIKIAYREAASDAQALTEEPCETGSGRRELRSHEISPGRNKQKSRGSLDG